MCQKATQHAINELDHLFELDILQPQTLELVPLALELGLADVEVVTKHAHLHL